MLQARALPGLDLGGGVQRETVELGAQLLEFRNLAPLVGGGLPKARDGRLRVGAQCDPTLEGGGFLQGEQSLILSGCGYVDLRVFFHQAPAAAQAQELAEIPDNIFTSSPGAKGVWKKVS